MGDDQLAELLCAGHGFAHHLFVLHSSAVVREGDRIRSHTLEIGEPLSPLAHGYRAVGQDVDHRVTGDDIALDAQAFDAVGDGIQVRHRAHGGVASACGSP